uniref:Pyruvate formate-lyase-activating enzyme n=1 Tax=Prevotella sp. GTC17262 TaxID=3236797 RepID=A0AB33JHZ5_9BACT
METDKLSVQKRKHDVLAEDGLPDLATDMESPKMAFLHSTESFGSVDGPGIRFVIFLQGCPMRCRYCHNPDSWKKEELQKTTADELLDRAERYRSYWGKTGGITVSGGEALLQIDFLIELFAKAHERGINTCLDTSAQPFSRQAPFYDKFVQLMQHTDLVLLDIKHIDSEAHRRLTGHPNENILDAARCLSDMGKPVWIRHVLVPGLTDDENALRRLADFIQTLSNVQRIEVLPYHALGMYKWENLGIPYTLKDVPAPTKEQVEWAGKILRGEL